jgi:hypothetical protein
MLLFQSTRRRTTWSLIGALLTLLGCSADFGLSPKPSRMHPPYLAVVVFVDAPAEIVNRGPYSFRIRELSGTLGVDTSLRASPKDTIILPVQPATYRIDISDVPTTCGVREGTAQSVVVPERSNTSLARFFITCSPALVVVAYTDGVAPDSNYVLTVQGGTGTDSVNRAYLLAANDTTRFEAIKPGTYAVGLQHVAPNCVVVSDGGEQISAKITPTGGVFIAFRVICSEVARRPRIVQAVASYGGGSLAYMIRAIDPDRDIERTFVDVTDCNRKSVLPGGGLRRGGFSGFLNVTGKDTAVIIGGYDVAVSDDVLRNKCIAIWVADERGNTSDFSELPLPPRDAARSPTATMFNARLNGTTSLQAQLSVSDPNNDYVGMFGVYYLRDGIVAPPMDGQPDRLVLVSPGVIGAAVPTLPLGIGLGEWSDYLSFVVYLIDRAGNFTRLEDNDLFR